MGGLHGPVPLQRSRAVCSSGIAPKGVPRFTSTARNGDAPRFWQGGWVTGGFLAGGNGRVRVVDGAGSKRLLGGTMGRLGRWGRRAKGWVMGGAWTTLPAPSAGTWGTATATRAQGAFETGRWSSRLLRRLEEVERGHSPWGACVLTRFGKVWCEAWGFGAGGRGPTGWNWGSTLRWRGDGESLAGIGGLASTVRGTGWMGRVRLHACLRGRGGVSDTGGRAWLGGGLTAR